MNQKKITLIGAGLVVVIILIFSLSASSGESSSDIIITPKTGKFIVDITTSGSLEAKNSVKISGPSGLRNYRIWNVTIQDIIDEGTYVTKGQYVARLDPSEVTGKIKDAQLQVDEEQSEYIQTELDTALTLREARDNIINLEYAVIDKQLTLDQSQFEPPATIQKAEIELEKAKRALQQAKENYDIKQRQSAARMGEAVAELRKDKNELEGLQELAKLFIITAPENGMLIYKKSWDGKPMKEGSQIGAWDPVVATLPDLSKMLSKTYVNEVDIRKIKPKQEVEIGFDAFPGKMVKGVVTKVANVGEQRPNSDAKVFSVEVEVFGSDALLKPGMTTSNKIITNTVDSAIFIPLECLHSQDDSITYVFIKDGLNVRKQEVMIGNANANDVSILGGISSTDKIYLSNVMGMEEEKIDLLPEMNGKRNLQDEPEEMPEPQGQPMRRRRPNS
ncbi:MAG: efflux RND transporter periplasmic adaptor subunit [Cyclobacteriaceae bacterium]